VASARRVRPPTRSAAGCAANPCGAPNIASAAIASAAHEASFLEPRTFVVTNVRSSGQIPRIGLQPVADDEDRSAMFAGSSSSRQPWLVPAGWSSEHHVKQENYCYDYNDSQYHRQRLVKDRHYQTTALCLAVSYRQRLSRLLPQSSSASRFTAGAAGFLILSQCCERPER
jgi:hypothetical protein